MNTIFTWDLKQLYLQNPSADYSNYLDVSLAVYLENSEQVIDLEMVCRLKEIENNEQSVENLGNWYLQNFDDQTLYLWRSVESPLAIILAKMEAIGVYIDKATLGDISVTMRAQATKLQEEILAELGESINLNSTKQLGETLVKRGFKLKASKASGNYATNRQVLEELAVTDTTGLINSILSYRTLIKLISNYTENLITLLDEKSRIHCHWNQTIAVTGRLNSTDPNLQNIPIRNKEYGSLIRQCFQPAAGKVFVIADYSQIELRFLAHFSGDENLIKAFEQNLDIHRQTAALMFDVPLDKVTDEQRVFGKTLNFALVYQQGTFATARMLGIKQKQAQEFTDKYFQAFPKVKPFVESTLNFARENKFVSSLLGRRRYFSNISSTNFFQRQIDERQAFNAVLQGSNADLIKLAMINLDNEFQKQNLEAQIVLQVHDELVIEADKNIAEKVQQIVVDKMTNFENIQLKVPIKVDYRIGGSWLKEV